jgi:hypothetical protein
MFNKIFTSFVEVQKLFFLLPQNGPIWANKSLLEKYKLTSGQANIIALCSMMPLVAILILFRKYLIHGHSGQFFYWVLLIAGFIFLQSTIAYIILLIRGSVPL